MGKKKGPRKAPSEKKPPLTHFLCLPLVNAASRTQLVSSLDAFKQDVSPSERKIDEDVKQASERHASQSDATLPYVHPKAIRPVGALHCTLGVMSLDQEKLSEAIEFLHGAEVQCVVQSIEKSSTTSDEAETTKGQPSSSGEPAKADDTPDGRASLKRSVSPPKIQRATGPLTVSLRGLTSMHSPHKTSILYTAPTDESERLYPLCVAIQKLFRDQGFLIEDNRQLKLHATIVNTIYAKGRNRRSKANATLQQTPEPATTKTANDGTSEAPQNAQPEPSQGHGPNANAPLKIDATAILEKYKDFVWAEDVVLDRVAICEMGAKKILNTDGNVKDEQYTEVASVTLHS